MIVLREYQDKDLECVNYILAQENIIDSNQQAIIYVVLDHKDLIGVARVESQCSKNFLKYLVIKKEERKMGFGDALIRAILFKLANSNEDKVYFKGNNEYLLKKGFKKEKENLLTLDINDFFDNACNCTGDCHGL